MSSQRGWVGDVGEEKRDSSTIFYCHTGSSPELRRKAYWICCVTTRQGCAVLHQGYHRSLPLLAVVPSAGQSSLWGGLNSPNTSRSQRSDILKKLNCKPSECQELWSRSWFEAALLGVSRLASYLRTPRLAFFVRLRS